MIIKNEEAVLERCLESVKGLVDEIILVDTGSEDGSMEIGRRFTSYVYEYPWEDDFAAARNYSFSKASGDYIMWLDADDVLPERSFRRLLQEKENMGLDTDIWMLPYQTAFDGEGKPLFTFERERIVRNGPLSVWVGAVHEVIVPYGVIRHIDAPIVHKKEGAGDRDRNLRIYEKLLEQKGTMDLRQQYYYGRELYDHGSYEKAERVLQGVAESAQTWVENRIEALRLLAYCRYALGKEGEALNTLLQSLAWDAPRAEICCDIGRHLYDRGKYEAAVFWYQTALQSARRPERGGFIEEDCYGFLPNLQLCLCYDRLGDYERAEFYNEEAGKIKPHSAYYLQNKEYFRLRHPSEGGQ